MGAGRVPKKREEFGEGVIEKEPRCGPRDGEEEEEEEDEDEEEEDDVEEENGEGDVREVGNDLEKVEKSWSRSDLKSCATTEALSLDVSVRSCEYFETARASCCRETNRD